MIQEVAGALITVTSVVLAVYFGLQNRRYQRENRRYQEENRRLYRTRYRYSWEDIHQGVLGLREKIKKRGVAPDVIVTVTGSGAVVANLYMKLLDKRLPIYHVMIEDPDERWGYVLKDHEVVEGHHWVVHIPKSVLGERRDRNILILDSSFFSGDTIRAIRDFLERSGFSSITLACLLRTTPPTGTTFSPDLYYYENPTVEFYYPWGPG